MVIMNAIPLVAHKIFDPPQHPHLPFILSILSMTKHKRQLLTHIAKCGALDHFLGFKLAFLVFRAASYQQGMDLNSVSEFYDKVTRDFIVKYEEEEPFYNNPDKDPSDPDNSQDLDGTGDEDKGELLSKKEAERKAMVFFRLRTMS